jgi:hypothetical protein
VGVKISTTDQAGRVVRVEMTEQQARELALGLVKAADASGRMYPWLC